MSGFNERHCFLKKCIYLIKGTACSFGRVNCSYIRLIPSTLSHVILCVGMAEKKEFGAEKGNFHDHKVSHARGIR